MYNSYLERQHYTLHVHTIIIRRINIFRADKMLNGKWQDIYFIKQLLHLTWRHIMYKLATESLVVFKQQITSSHSNLSN